MKNILHILFLLELLLVGKNVNSQGNYFVAGSEWKVSIINHVYYPCIENDTRIYYLAGDSIVGAVTYQKVMQRGSKELMWTGSSNPSTSCEHTVSNYNNEFVMLVRQDNYKTYLYNNNQEVLLFDYDLQIGDFIQPSYLYASDSQDSLQVVDIDTVQINGEDRRLFHLEDDQHTTSYKLVEGVAHFRGFLEPLVVLPLSITTTMECYGINGIGEYSFLSEPCAFNLGTKKIIEDSDFMIYPIPSSELLHIKSIAGHSIPVSVTILDLQGKSSQVSPYSEAINISHLQHGSYILSIQFENGNSINKLIIKN